VLCLNARSTIRLLTFEDRSYSGKETHHDDRTSFIAEWRALPLGLRTPWVLGPGVDETREREVTHDRGFDSAHGSCLKRHDYTQAILEDYR
jgi:hypothetical protein